MKKLIALRPILYMGRTYKRGDAVPANDDKMVSAWLRAGSAAWSGPETPGEAKDSGEGGEPAMLTGHLDAADLATWKKADLERLAADMGVDISEARNNAERAAILAAAEVQSPVNDPESSGGGQ